MDRPIFLLDVDGVINCFPTYIPRRDRPAPDSLHTFQAEGFEINVRLKVAEWLQTLPERADLRWLTTWGRLANHSLVPHLGLPELPVQAEEENEDRYGTRLHKSLWWKFEAVQKLIADEPERRVVWVDDDISSWPKAIDFIDRRHKTGIGLLLGLSPDPDRGLSDDHMTLIDRFIGE